MGTFTMLLAKGHSNMTFSFLDAFSLNRNSPNFHTGKKRIYVFFVFYKVHFIVSSFCTQFLK